jgi:signal transduction histidine kinase
MGTHRLRTLQHIVRLEGKTMHLTMAGIVDEHYDILKMVESSYLIFLPLMLLASIAGGFMLSHRALEPVDRITRAARTLGINDLHRRLPVPHTGDELQRLAETWNELLERLERAVKGLTQLTSDVSHDLRTTITVMLATAQLALSRERTNQQYREAMQTIMQECQSTTVLLNDLLAAARADAPEQNIELLPVPLNELVREVAASLKARAEMKQQDLYVFTDDELYVLGDASLLRRLITILLDNAIKYTGTSGRISMVARKHQQYTVLEVCDTGIGIAPEDITRIFDRFYRVDSTRSRNEGGHGLGLAIAKWIADVHDADIRIRPNERQGTVFEVRFAIRKDGPRLRDNRRELATLSR